MSSSDIEAAADAYMDARPDRFKARAYQPPDPVPGTPPPTGPDLPAQPPFPVDPGGSGGSEVAPAAHPGEVPAETKSEAIKLGEAYAPFGA